MRSFIFALCVVLLGLSLNGCSHSKAQQDAVLLIPLPPNPVDPTDEIARAAVQKFLTESGAPIASKYDLRRYDLNGDGRREALIFLKAPYRFWCGTHGCTILVMQAHNDRFTLVNDIQPVRAPLYVSANKTQGWHDLIVRVSGRWDEARDVALRFNGRHYPRHPDTVPNEPHLASYDIQQSGVRLFHD